MKLISLFVLMYAVSLTAYADQHFKICDVSKPQYQEALAKGKHGAIAADMAANASENCYRSTGFATQEMVNENALENCKKDPRNTDCKVVYEGNNETTLEAARTREEMEQIAHGKEHDPDESPAATVLGVLGTVATSAAAASAQNKRQIQEKQMEDQMAAKRLQIAREQAELAQQQAAQQQLQAAQQQLQAAQQQSAARAAAQQTSRASATSTSPGTGSSPQQPSALGKGYAPSYGSTPSTALGANSGANQSAPTFTHAYQERCVNEQNPQSCTFDVLVTNQGTRAITCTVDVVLNRPNGDGTVGEVSARDVGSVYPGSTSTVSSNWATGGTYNLTCQ